MHVELRGCLEKLRGLGDWSETSWIQPILGSLKPEARFGSSTQDRVMPFRDRACLQVHDP